MCKDKTDVMRYATCVIVLNARIEVRRTSKRCMMPGPASLKKADRNRLNWIRM